MRISDWSSDVCSSDLGAQTVGTADNPVVILEQLAAGKRAVLIVDQADAVSEVSGRTAELRRVVLALVRKAALYPRVQLIFACRSFDLENDHRSEEHTSELQSLMRISYAVFCLKKKNNNTHSIPTNATTTIHK